MTSCARRHLTTISWHYYLASLLLICNEVTLNGIVRRSLFAGYLQDYPGFQLLCMDSSRSIPEFQNYIICDVEQLNLGYTSHLGVAVCLLAGQHPRDCSCEDHNKVGGREDALPLDARHGIIPRTGFGLEHFTYHRHREHLIRNKML